MQHSDTLPQTSTQQAGLKDLTGQTFGTLRVISRAENYKGNKSGEASWQVQCTLCGFVYPKAIRGSFLRGGRANGGKCLGCRGDRGYRSDALAFVVDAAFIKKWTPLLCASIGKVLGFGREFAEHKDDLLQDIWLQLSKYKGEVPERALSTFLWQVGRTDAINFLKRRESRTHHPTIAGDEETYFVVVDNLTDGAQEPEPSTPQREAFRELSDEEQQFCREYFADTRFKHAADRQRAADIRERLKQRAKEMTLQEVHAA
jgi:hypothetical protein